MMRVKLGDMPAFEALVDKYKQPVLNFVIRTLGDEKEAEDLAQVVFIQVFRSAHRYQGTAKFISWLFTIARNLCLNEIRRRSRHPADPLESKSFGAEEAPCPQFEDVRVESPLNSVLLGELTGQVEHALADLPEAQRTAILLICHDEMSYDEIAQVLGISLAATRSLIHRARERLKQRLRRYLQTTASHDCN
jgi:RNA polymerase sigma-70 factor, ECF subfamily